LSEKTFQVVGRGSLVGLGEVAVHIDLDAGPGPARAISLAADWFSEHARS